MHDIRPLRVHFEYDADDLEYTHKHVLDVSAFKLTAHEFAGQLDAQAASIEAMLEQRMMQAGMDSVEADFDVSVIDDETVGIQQTATAAGNVTEDDFFVSAVAGESGQLISLIGLVDHDEVEDVITFIEQMVGQLSAQPGGEIEPEDTS